MKKRLLCTILILVMMFGATVPTYAEAWTSNQAQNVTSGVSQILAQLLQLNSKFGDIDGSGRGVFDNILLELEHLAGWLVPDGARDASQPTLIDSMVVLTNYAMNHLPDISVIAGNVSSWMNQNLNTLNYIRWGVGYANVNNRDAIQKQMHLQLGNSSDDNYIWGIYHLRTINDNGQSSDFQVQWPRGTAIGNIALILQRQMLNDVYAYEYLWKAALTDYTGQLGIWDSQGETLTQEGWSPTSAINGLYKYLAYTQRDVARLTYVLASDEEIETREKARENQEAVLDNFVDPEGTGSVSASNFGDIASASDSFKDNMNTGVSASGIFDVFTGDHTSRWFSTEMANSINNVGSGSRSLKAATPPPTYETPLLDAKMTELLGIFGGDN